MKKNRILLSAFAVLLAVGGAFASSQRVHAITAWYKADNVSTTTCTSTEILHQCVEGEGICERFIEAVDDTRQLYTTSGCNVTYRETE